MPSVIHYSWKISIQICNEPISVLRHVKNKITLVLCCPLMEGVRNTQKSPADNCSLTLL